MIVTQPSMRSKFDHILRRGFIPKMSEIKTAMVNIVTLSESQENLGASFLSRGKSSSHNAQMISIIILKTKPFPVINGKNRLLAIYKGMNGTRKMRPKMVFLKILCDSMNGY